MSSADSGGGPRRTPPTPRGGGGGGGGGGRRGGGARPPPARGAPEGAALWTPAGVSTPGPKMLTHLHPACGRDEGFWCVNHRLYDADRPATRTAGRSAYFGLFYWFDLICCFLGSVQDEQERCPRIAAAVITTTAASRIRLIWSTKIRKITWL